MKKTTPMLRQYLEIKKQYPGTILFFRLGDFYEMFNEDAVVASRELEITLTARHKKTANPVPMCGVPHHAAANYISKLIKKGYRVAICEQTEDATQTKKLVKREVVKVITPGTAIDEQLLEKKEPVYLASVCGSGDTYGVSYLELSTGEFISTQIEGTDAWQKTCSDIESFSPRELLFPRSLRKLVESNFKNAIQDKYSNTDSNNILQFKTENTSNKFTTTITELDEYLFDSADCERVLTTQFEVKDLSGFGLENKTEAIRSAGACLQYAHQTQRATAEHIAEINYFEASDSMILDSITLRNLEITESSDIEKSNKRSLLGVIDETVTGMGGRLLRSWLLRPSVKRTEIQTRLSAVSELTDSMLRDKIRFLLKEVADLERLVGRLNLGTATPRDLLALNRSLSKTPDINTTLSDAQSLLLQVLSENIFELKHIQDLISCSISDEPPININDGGVIKEEYNTELDELRNVSSNAKQTIAGFESDEKQRTGISNLRIKFNNVFGYFIEVSKANSSKVPEDYERRQTLTNAERYTTPQLKEWEVKVLGAEEKIKVIEQELFKQIRTEVTKETRHLQSTARALATLDALASLAEIAIHRNYVQPELHDSDDIEIRGGRHPIVEAFLSDSFIPNDLVMNNSTDRMLIITGANMGGKCLEGNTLIFTNEGLKRLSDFKQFLDIEKEFSETSNVKTKTRLGKENVTHFHSNGRKETICLKTRFGYEIEGTKEHKIWVRKSDGSEQWVYFEDISKGDYVAIERNIDLWGKNIEITNFSSKLTKNSITYPLPTKLDKDIGYLLGLLIGDGTTTYKDSFTLTTKDESIASEFIRIIKEKFNYTVSSSPKHLSYRVFSKYIRIFLEKLDLGYKKSFDKYIPKSILSAPKEIVVAFLQGLFDTDGYVANHQAKVFYSSSSKKLAQEVQMLLLNLGIISSLKVKKTKCLPSYQLGIYGADAILFHKKVGFRLERKNVRKKLASKLRMPNIGIPHFQNTLRQVQSDLVSNQDKPVSIKNTKHIRSIFYTYLPNQCNISYNKLNQLINYCNESDVYNNDLINVQKNSYFYDKIESIEKNEKDVFDLSIENDHSYIANGFVSHNSTVLRQSALIQILAQIGSFVPATIARLPIIDRVWTRVGASDDLASGRSTFMVEMTETATILHNSTSRSLILLDEIGRGTSTFDGLAIAWAVAEYLHNSPEHSAKTLFATHYHELTELAEKLPGAKNYQLTAKEKDGDIVFLHKLEKGKASKSYGIAVAKLAGLPAQTIARANQVLNKLEQYELAVFKDKQIADTERGLETAIGKASKSKIASQVSLFAMSNENIIDEIRELDLNNISDEESKRILKNLKERTI